MTGWTCRSGRCIAIPSCSTAYGPRLSIHFALLVHPRLALLHAQILATHDPEQVFVQQDPWAPSHAHPRHNFWRCDSAAGEFLTWVFGAKLQKPTTTPPPTCALAFPNAPRQWDRSAAAPALEVAVLIGDELEDFGGSLTQHEAEQFATYAPGFTWWEVHRGVVVHRVACAAGSCCLATCGFRWCWVS